MRSEFSATTKLTATRVPLSGGRVELEAAAGQRLGALAHVAESHAGHVVGRDAAAIIDDREADPIRLAAERDLDPRRAGVAQHVGQRLVDDAQQRFLAAAAGSGGRSSSANAGVMPLVCDHSIARARRRSMNGSVGVGRAHLVEDLRELLLDLLRQPLRLFEALGAGRRRRAGAARSRAAGSARTLSA